MTIVEVMTRYEERIKDLEQAIKDNEDPANPLWFSRGQALALTQVLTDLEILRQHYDI